MAEVSVRRARREDWPRMMELDRQLATFEKLPLPTEAEAARLGSMLFDEKKIEALVAERDGRIDGMAIFWESLGSSFRARPFLFLEDLVVDESARSGGVGEALMAALAREGVRRGAMRIEWAVLDWNVNAIPLLSPDRRRPAAGLDPVLAARGCDEEARGSGAPGRAFVPV